jgi:glycerol-3-phosphate dehydrogenase subunit B
LIQENPIHPYSLAGLDALYASLQAFQALCSDAGYPLHGSLERNWLFPSALGALRPTCLAPETMIAGDLNRRDPMLLVGFEGWNDFYPGLAAANLAAQGVLANALTLDLSSLRTRRFINASILAGWFEQEEFLHEVASTLKPRLGQCGRVGFPAVLGYSKAIQVKHELEALLGCEIYEIPGLPPSVPGIRLHNILVREIEKNGGRVFNGMLVLDAEAENGTINTVWTEAAARRRAHRASTFVLATGSILGGGLAATQDDSLVETIFDLAISPVLKRREWFSQDFLDRRGHPVFQVGVRVNEAFQPLDMHGLIAYENLFAVGSVLGGTDYFRERSFDGVALISGYHVGSKLAGPLSTAKA